MELKLYRKLKHAICCIKEQIKDRLVPLDFFSGGLISSDYLPSYVDDVLEVANYATLPTTGETGKIYVTLNDNKQYRWSGSTYIPITNGNYDYEALDFVAPLTSYEFKPDVDIKIDSVTNITGSPTTTITVNAAPYVLGNTITAGDTINVSVSIVSFIRLNMTRL